jgi:hypothetical protein
MRRASCPRPPVPITRARGCDARAPREGVRLLSLVHPHPEYQIHEAPGELVIDLPSPRRPLTAFVITLWLAGWAVGMSFVVQQFRSGGAATADRPFLLAWAGTWLAAGVCACAWLAWLVAGRERVTVRADALHIRRWILAWGVTRAYPLSTISELRTFGREVPPLLAAGLDITGRGASGVRFRCGPRVVRFARALDEHAAHAVVDVIRARLPLGQSSHDHATTAA